MFFFQFFVDLLSSISSLNICLVKNLIFSGFLSTGSPQSHNPNHKSKRLARVDFGPFLMHFLKIFFYRYFFFAILFMGSSQFHVQGHVFDLFTQVGCRVHSRIFNMFPSYRQVSILYIFLMCSAFHNIFYGVGLFNHFCL